MPGIMMLGREIRRRPFDWEHPKDPRGNYLPQFDELWDECFDRWCQDYAAWKSGTHDDQRRYPQHAALHFCEWHGGPPDPDSYRLRTWPADAELGIQMYETVSEGTPISAIYPDTAAGRLAMAEELVQSQTDTIVSHFTVNDWLDVINERIFGIDIQTGEPQ